LKGTRTFMNMKVRVPFNLAERVGLCALRAHPSLRSGPSPLRGSVLRRAARASSNPGALVHPHLAANPDGQRRISGPGNRVSA